MKSRLICYDNHGETLDRYTIMPPKEAREYRQNNGTYLCLCCDDHPYHPLGIGMSGTASYGPHLGQKISFDSLPDNVKQLSRLFFPMFC